MVGAARRLAQVQARALAAVEAARGEAARVSRELEALAQQFRAYQAMKAGEVAGLEARLRVALAQPLAQPHALRTSATAGRQAATPCGLQRGCYPACRAGLLRPAPDQDVSRLCLHAWSILRALCLLQVARKAARS